MVKFSFIATLILIAVFTGIAEPKEKLPTYNLSVSFDTKNSLLKGTARITFQEDKMRTIHIADLQILSVMFNEQMIKPDTKGGKFKLRGKGILEMTYEVLFEEEEIEEDLENVGVVSQNVISDEGISLTTVWYPYFGGMAFWNLKALVPHGLIAISEADEIHKMDTAKGIEYTFHFPYPLEGINLVAGPYKQHHESYRDIEIYTYFFPEDTALSENYIDYSKKYLSLYEELLGPYPYKQFSIVENILPTGYSMPTFTLLGQDVVRLPFIIETSLGHEILHQWFGNYVYVDYARGNWVEAITSYLSDHLYEEQKRTGWKQRKKILTDYQSYVTPVKEAALKDFTARTDFASSAIGYGKGAMLFHMLKNHIGEDTFYLALRRFIEEEKFSKASWEEIESAFEKVLGKNLDWFFSQWLTRKDIPLLEVKNLKVVVLKGVPTVSFDIVQKRPYKLTLPFRIVTEDGEIKNSLQIENERHTFDIAINEKPLRIIFDDGYDLMRRLTKKELAPVISRLLGDEERLITYPEKAKEKYSKLINVFEEEGFIAKEEQEVKDNDIKTSSLLVLGFESLVLKRLYGQVMKPEVGFTLIVKDNPLNTARVVTFAEGDSKEEIDPVVRKLFHYGKYSLLRFKGGENIEKVTEETERGIIFTLYEPILGINARKYENFNEILNTVIDKPIIYVGERHTNYEDHKVQLEILMELFKRGKKFAIGMEMFQRPFQEALDEYLSGVISEKEFLKESEYFKRWKYDYHLYREIMEFAKAKRIPVIALNVRTEIIKKVAEGGLDALTEEERREIPEDMDMADDDYRERLMRVYELHPETSSFEYFYQSQILWDETMAHSIAGFMDDNPDYQMIVLTGTQHIMFGSGIPKRAYRLNGRDFATLINGLSEELEKDIGDFVLFPSPITLPDSPRLGVLIEEKDSRIQIKKFHPESIALKAGLKKGDILVSIDDWKIESIEDVKIALFGKKRGETITVKALRKRFLFGEKVLEFYITLQ